MQILEGDWKGESKTTLWRPYALNRLVQLGASYSEETPEREVIGEVLDRWCGVRNDLRDAGRYLKDLLAALDGKQSRQAGEPDTPLPPAAGDPAPTAKKPKRSTEWGAARAKIIAALTKHHQYADGGCLNLEPIGNNELARKAGVSKDARPYSSKKSSERIRGTPDIEQLVVRWPGLPNLTATVRNQGKCGGQSFDPSPFLFSL